ncbi:MAG TPA: cholesterol oxidase substrate-binding domain-containing protein [Streptosporangiaceae bacterium]|nr:cholesterol oxidase substrate-binding domain-containing protein [Streptosporangiaceae bacterium]
MKRHQDHMPDEERVQMRDRSRDPEASRHSRSPRISRRGLLAGAGAGAAAAALGWLPGTRIAAGSAAAIPAPPNFPPGISLYQQTFVNWAQQIDIPGVWTCSPRSDADVVTLANWADQNGYKLRPLGMGHNWSPLVLYPGENASNVVLVNTTDYLTAVSINSSGAPVTVTAQAGATMNSLLSTLQNAGYGFTTVPAPGDLTIGGVLAIDGHGTAIQGSTETPVPGTSFGSLSNLIQSMTVVAWNGSSYALQTFQRTDPAIAPFLTHLGRTFVTEVTLEAGANQMLQCQSLTNIPVSELFAPPGSAGSNSFASLVNGPGRVEAIWFPFTTYPWIKIWSRQLTQPAGSAAVTSPYVYTFANSITTTESNLISDIVDGLTFLTPEFEGLEESIVQIGLPATNTANIWGPSADVLLYVLPTTLRVTAGGWTIITSKSSIQQVVSDFYTQYNNLVHSYQDQFKWPMNGPLEIRVTGLDVPGEAGVAGAVTPLLSAITPRPDHPNWDVAIWIDMLTIPGTPASNSFYQTMEKWIFSHYTGSYATVRPEWSKGWAFSSSGAWTDSTMLTSTIPAAINAGQAQDNFQVASAAFDTHDPHRVFSNTFLDTLLP